MKSCAAAIGVLLFLVASGPRHAGAQQPPSWQPARSLHFRAIGPAVMGGRVDDIAASASLPHTAFLATATGGLWKTTDGGTAWQPVFDSQHNLSIGSVAVSPSNPAIIWVGTGEANNRQSSSWGDGVYKSTDGALTWKPMGLDQTQSIGRIVVDPTDPNVVYVAALGHLWGPNPERGLFKTANGGVSWAKVLFISDDTGVSDVVVNPRSPNIVLAAAYERRRTPWGFNGGGPEGGIYRSVDGGSSWTKVSLGLPTQGNLGRIALALYARDPNVVYALVQTAEPGRTGVYRSGDAGLSWHQAGTLDPRPSYFSQIRVDPNNDLRLWMLGVSLYYSQDGGKTFSTSRRPFVHSDFHALWIDPHDSQHLILGSDGGVYVTRDAGRHWDYRNVMPLGQAYHVAYDDQQPYHVCAGFQDNGEWCGPSRTLSHRGITNSDWRLTGGFDGMHVIPDPQDPSIVYSEWDDGNVWRRNLHTNQALQLKPTAPAGAAHYRFNWNTPLLLSAHNPNTLYLGAQTLLKSTDRGDSWTPISPDLTSNRNRNQMPVLGVLPSALTLSLNDGVSAWPTISAIAESPLSASVLWVGTDDGNLQVTRDDGKSWTNVVANVPGVPKGTYVSGIDASRTAPGAAYAAFDGHRNDDDRIYLLKTTDYGQTWHSIAAGLPASAGSIHVVREAPLHSNVLIVGAQFGGFFSLDNGASWHLLGMGLPHVQVDDVQFQPRANDLIVATHGRALYILDNISALEELSPAVRDAPLHLFPVHSAVEWRVNGDPWFPGEQFIGPNPPNGALLDFYLKESPAPSEAAAVTVRDAAGNIVRVLSVTHLHAGINRAVWDFRRATAVPQAPNAIAGFATAPTVEPGGYGDAYDSTAHGIMVPAGRYSISIAVGGTPQSQPLQVLPDPRLPAGPAAEAARQALWLHLNAMYGTASADHDLLDGTLRSLRAAQDDWEHSRPAALGASILAQAHALAAKLSTLDQHLALPPRFGAPASLLPRISALMGQIETYVAQPTAPEQLQAGTMARQLAQAQASLQVLLQTDLVNLNAALTRARVPRITSVPVHAAPPPSPFAGS